MDSISAIDLSSTVGLIAMVMLTLNILMGLLVSVNYNPKTWWPHRKLEWLSGNGRGSVSSNDSAVFQHRQVQNRRRTAAA
jgi:hypothetical protein